MRPNVVTVSVTVSIFNMELPQHGMPTIYLSSGVVIALSHLNLPPLWLLFSTAVGGRGMRVTLSGLVEVLGVMERTDLEWEGIA